MQKYTQKTEEYKWKYTKEKTITLKANTKYEIRIRPYKTSTIAEQKLKLNINSILARTIGVAMGSDPDYYKSQWFWNKNAKWEATTNKAVNWSVK